MKKSTLKKLTNFVKKDEGGILSNIYIKGDKCFVTNGYIAAVVSTDDNRSDLLIPWKQWGKFLNGVDPSYLYDGKYPDIEKIWPDTYGHKALNINKKALKDALKILKGINNDSANYEANKLVSQLQDRYNSKKDKDKSFKRIKDRLKKELGQGYVYLHLTETNLRLSGYNEKGDNQAIDIPCKWDGYNKFEVGFNGNYLLNILDMLQEGNIEILLFKEFSPGVINNTGNKFLIMPIKP